MKNEKKYERSASKINKLIPGGAHTYSKGRDQFPLNAPALIIKGKGCKLYGVDGREYTDFAMSLGSVLLGHAYRPVISAVKRELEKGSNFCRPSVIEGELAELINTIIPSAEMVKFGKHGSDAVTAAVKLARGYTGRKYVVRCNSDPFNAVHDWFIGSTIMNRGVPDEVKNLTLKFDYNDIEGCKKLVEKYHGEIACFVLEPISFTKPKDEFLEKLLQLCESNGIILIFDEVVSGFRFDLGGVQKYVNVIPHLSAFGKGMANGFSISALVGKREIMELAGIDHNEERVFIMSATHGGETHCFAAAIACIGEIMEKNLIDYFWDAGKNIIEGISFAAKRVGASNFIKTGGYDVKPSLVICDEKGSPSEIVRTFFLQETIKRGIMIPYIVPAYSHKPKVISKSMEAIEEVLYLIQSLGEEKRIAELIEGPLVKPVFRQYN